MLLSCFSYFIAAPNVFRVGVDETVFVSFAQQKRLELSVQDSRSSKVVFHVVKNFKPGERNIFGKFDYGVFILIYCMNLFSNNLNHRCCSDKY